MGMKSSSNSSMCPEPVVVATAVPAFKQAAARVSPDLSFAEPGRAAILAEPADGARAMPKSMAVEEATPLRRGRSHLRGIVRDERGQELVEMGIAIILFILLVGGVVQFGHAFMVTNWIVQSARDGARLAASWADRGACQQLSSAAKTTIQTTVKDQIANLTAETFTVAVDRV